VVLREDLSVDDRETQRLRDRMSSERGALPMFDRGGTIDELKARCKKDTQLDPPRAPIFQKWMTKGSAPAQAAE
jgi:N-methylhydantoinase B